MRAGRSRQLVRHPSILDPFKLRGMDTDRSHPEPSRPERSYPEGVPSWIDTEQSDLDAAQRFYGELLGWTFEVATPPTATVRYVVASLDGQDVAGLTGGADAGRARWNTYLAVDDADSAAARVTAAGGTVTTDPVNVGEGGRWAGCTDPTGAEFRLWQARGRLGAQAVNTPGAWNFSDLHTDDADAAVTYYCAVFGWEVDELGFASMLRRPGYGDHLASTVDPGIHERQSSAGAPPGFADAIGWVGPVEPGLTPHWHATFTVADRDTFASLAERLGAEILDSADTDWTRTALIRDPQGALFTGSQFTPPS
jgi:predicted enzyme related to lactoylglutathione lyase